MPPDGRVQPLVLKHLRTGEPLRSLVLRSIKVALCCALLSRRDACAVHKHDICSAVACPCWKIISGDALCIEQRPSDALKQPLAVPFQEIPWQQHQY